METTLYKLSQAQIEMKFIKIVGIFFHSFSELAPAEACIARAVCLRHTQTEENKTNRTNRAATEMNIHVRF